MLQFDDEPSARTPCHLLKGPEAEDHTLYASHTVRKTMLCLRHGQNQRRSGQRTVGPGTTSRCIWITRSSKGLRCARQWGTARPQRRWPRVRRPALSDRKFHALTTVRGRDCYAVLAELQSSG